MLFELSYTVPGQDPQKVVLDQPTMLIGTLLSNQVVIRGEGIDPIHALIESHDDGSWYITDLGSDAGVILNGQKISVESKIQVGDAIGLGSVMIAVNSQSLAGGEDTQDSGVIQPISNVPPLGTVGVTQEQLPPQKQTPKPATAAKPSSKKKEDKTPVLFSPRNARPSGDVLEVVAYWGDTILEVEHFRSDLKGFEQVTIGDPRVAHFLAGGKENVKMHVLGTVSSSGYKVRLREGMEARLRKGGQVEKVSKGSHKLGRRDIAQVKYGAIKYFFLFVRPPKLKLPKGGPKDPFFLSIMSFILLVNCLITGLAWLSGGEHDKDNEKEDAWVTVNLPEYKKPTPKPLKNVIKKKKEPPKPKKVPPPPKPKPVKPAKPKVVEKPKQVKPVKTPAKKPAIKPAVKPAPKPAVKPKPAPNPKKNAGMARTAKRPDNKNPGKVIPKLKQGRNGGSKGVGLRQKGASRKGKQNFSVKGVEGVKNKKASGVNLSKLGVGLGKVLKKKGAGANYTNFANSAGGGGGGAGSGTRNLGLGGVGNQKSIGIGGVGRAAGNFGQGTGGTLSGGGGGGGLGGGFGSGRGSGGRSAVNVNVAAPAEGIDGGLTQQEVKMVIQAHLNEIRHCYEQLLQRQPSASGKVKVSFVVKTNGRVGRASVVQSSIRDARMKGCVTSKVQTWKFPRPRGGKPVTVKYPFAFSPL